MKIGIKTWGGDGDIFPFLALANGLRSAGHQVTVVYTSSEDYTSIIAEAMNIKLIKVFKKSRM